MSSEQKIGYVSVDSGRVWLGDPCYVVGEDASSGVSDWSEFCGNIDFDKEWNAPLGEGVGFCVASGWGDGSYPVYATIEDGRVASLRVVFMQDDEDEV